MAGGAKNGVACFAVSIENGLTPVAGLRPLKELHTNTPPSGPPDQAPRSSSTPANQLFA